MGVFHVFKLCKWYQIAQNITYREKSAASRIFAYLNQKHENNDQLKLITLCSAFITDCEKSHKLHSSFSKSIIVLTILKSKELTAYIAKKVYLQNFMLICYDWKITALLLLTRFRPMFHLRINQVVGFH